MTTSKESRFCNVRIRLNNKMKSIICILALLCTVYALDVNSRKCEVLKNNQKKVCTIQLTKLSNFADLMKRDTKIKFNEIKTGASFDVNNIIDKALEKVKLTVDKAKLEGKNNVDDCYNEANSILNKRKPNVMKELDTCIQNGQKVMEDSLGNVAKDIQMVKDIQADLNAIGDCDMMKLIQHTMSLKRIDCNVKGIPAVKVAYPKTITVVRICTAKVVVNFDGYSTVIVTDADTCIKTSTTPNADTSSNNA